LKRTEPYYRFGCFIFFYNEQNLKTMKRINVRILIFPLLSIMFLASCEQPENQIIGLWLFDSLQRTAYEDGELTATATEYFTGDEVVYWEFQELELLAYEGSEKELEQTFSWVIEDGETLILSRLDRDDRDDTEFTISGLNRKELVLMDEQYSTDGDILNVIEIVYTLKRVEE
jgi:hypothetical protein